MERAARLAEWPVVCFAGRGVHCLMLAGAHAGATGLAGFCAAMAGTWLGFPGHNAIRPG